MSTRIAVFGDIHGNLPALDAVYCRGDLVGYAPFPNEATERIRRERIPTIMGNYDDGVGFDRNECGCAYRREDERLRGQQSLEWTTARVTAANKTFVAIRTSELPKGFAGELETAGVH